MNSRFTKTAGGVIKTGVDAFQCPVGVFHLPANRLIGSKRGYFLPTRSLNVPTKGSSGGSVPDEKVPL